MDTFSSNATRTFNGVDYDLVRTVYLAARDAEVDVALLAGIITVESRWDPRADGDFEPGPIGPDEQNGSRGEFWSHGLGQIHRRYAGAGLTRESLYDPRTNTQVAARTLRAGLATFPQLEAAIASYNQGIGGVQRDGWQWNFDRYVRPVLEAAEQWRPHLRRVITLALIDSIWGANEQLRRGKSRRFWTAYIQHELIRLKKATGLE